MSHSAAREMPVRVRVELGKPFSYHFGEGNYVIRRHPDIQHPTGRNGAQYIFAAPGVRGWTTDGTDVIADGARLHWNGILEFDEFKETDLGQYNRPLEFQPDPSMAPIQFVFYAMGDDEYVASPPVRVCGNL